MDNKDFETNSEDIAQNLIDALQKWNESLDEFENAWKRHYGVLVNEIKLKCSEKFMFYTNKYAQSTFLTRWYWKRKMEKLIKGIDVLKEL